MKWKDHCLSVLSTKRMFENSEHQTRFKELLDCYSSYPFFTKGLCKCMYLSAWDDEHFCIMLEILADMAIHHEATTKEMRSQGTLFAEEEPSGEALIYELSNTFLDNTRFQLDPSVHLDDRLRHIITRALAAAEIIDSI